MKPLISRDERATVAAHIASRGYDPATMQIHTDGSVTAKLDPNVTPGCHNKRLFAGWADQILDEAARLDMGE